jgi:tryptophan synthase beta chain
MGTVDIARQQPNVFRMRLLGAEVIPVESGSKTLKDAITEAIRDWVTNVETTFYLLGSALGPHPYPMMVRDFHRCMGIEARADILKAEGRLPDTVIACVGGGSNAIGIFHAFLNDPVKLVGVEAGGRSLKPGEHAARFEGGSPGVLHGAYTYMLQNEDGQAELTHSISAGLDYVLIGPEHALLHDQNRAEYTSCNDADALTAAMRLARTEGIIPALESAHAVSEAIQRAPSEPGKIYIVNLSGRGDKDTDIYRENLPDLDANS